LVAKRRERRKRIQEAERRRIRRLERAHGIKPSAPQARSCNLILISRAWRGIQGIG